jgi:hypothetical protein
MLPWYTELHTTDMIRDPPICQLCVTTNMALLVLGRWANLAFRVFDFTLCVSAQQHALITWHGQLGPYSFAAHIRHVVVKYAYGMHVDSGTQICYSSMCHGLQGLPSRPTVL